MPTAPDLDGVLIQWGERLFYPGSRHGPANHAPRLAGLARQQRAAALRERMAATVLRRAPQVMVKVTGGGRGMGAIAAHLRYISKNGRLEMEDERGDTLRGPGAVRSVAEQWRHGGSLIPEDGGTGRREALNIMLSMPRGTHAPTVQWAAREFAQVELAGHAWVMVLHEHQANPHVHISVRVEGRHGRRLNPRKADLHRWRETFAEKLRERGVEAEATRQATRGVARQPPALWQVKAGEQGRLVAPRRSQRTGAAAQASRDAAQRAWQAVAAALLGPGSTAQDRALGQGVQRLVQGWGGRGRQAQPLDAAAREAAVPPPIASDRGR